MQCVDAACRQVCPVSALARDEQTRAIVLNEDRCIGCGLCVQLCPKVFAMQDNGKSKAIEPTGDEEGNIQGAIDACPVQAITWNEEA